jgi:hypothetical protein
MTVRREHTMKKGPCRANHHADRQAVMSLALTQYNFSTPEIRVLMRCVLGHAISGRTIKRLAKDSGQRLKRGRPRTTPKIHKGDLSGLVELTSNGLDGCDGNALQLFHQVQGQFGLTPRQYLKWVATCFRRGKCMIRKCLLCDESFPSTDSGERHCSACRGNRRRLVNEERRSSFV